MIKEILILSTAATASPVGMQLPIQHASVARRCEAMQGEVTLEDRWGAVSVQEIQFVEPVGLPDMITAEDLWDSPFTLDEALSYGNALMKDGSSDFDEID